MNRIFFITTNFPPSESIGTQRIVKFCKFLNYDWDIHVLTLKQKYYPSNKFSDNKFARIRSKNLKIWRTEKLDIISLLIKIRDQLFSGHVVTDTTQPQNSKIANTKQNTNNKNIVKKLLSIVTDILEFPDKDIVWTPIAIAYGFFLIKKYDIDIIFASAPRHSNLIITTVLKKLTKKKMVVDYRDPWARTPWLNDLRSSSSLERLKHSIIKMLEKWIIQSADQAYFSTQALRDDFQQYYSNFNITPDKFITLYNGFDPERLKVISKNTSNRSHSEKLTFSHVGSLYKKRNPEKIVLAIRNLVTKKLIQKNDISFQFIGNLAIDLNYMHDLVKTNELKDTIKFFPPVSYDESYDYMAKSDILVLLQPGAKLMLPAKFFDYICFGKPIMGIGEKGGEVEKVVADKFGLFADCNDLQDIESVILQFITKKGDLSGYIPDRIDSYNFKNTVSIFETEVQKII